MELMLSAKAGGYGGKYGIDVLFATRNWSLCGKPVLQCQFATRERLERPGADWRRLIIVANMGLLVYLPHGSGVCVANQSCNGNLPHEKDWNSQALIYGH